MPVKQNSVKHPLSQNAEQQKNSERKSISKNPESQKSEFFKNMSKNMDIQQKLQIKKKKVFRKMNKSTHGTI